MKKTVFVHEFTDGILDPTQPMLGPVEDGGYIVANTTPGCWGPMITPELKGCNEVTKPVYVEGAEVGDAIVIYIKSIKITSQVSTSGTDQPVPGRFLDDPYVAAYCPKCDVFYPASEVKGIGIKAIKCKKCGEEISTFNMTNGYSIAFNEERNIGITLNKEMAEKVARDAKRYMAIPDTSIQHPAALIAPSNLVGMIARTRPFLGQLGTAPSTRIPDTHNSGDFGAFLFNTSHDYVMTEEELKKHKTDAHMDINLVREGTVVIAPVKVKGGGVYLGDAHAMQGNGEIAGHTTDVSALVVLRVKVLKGLNLDGPILLPLEEDLPHLAKPFNEAELRQAERLAKEWGMDKLEKTAPICFVGTGANLNAAVDNALNRGSKCLGMSLEEFKNRATITGSVDIGRAPGSVSVPLLIPIEVLEKVGLYDIIKEHYNLK